MSESPRSTEDEKLIQEINLKGPLQTVHNRKNEEG